MRTLSVEGAKNVRFVHKFFCIGTLFGHSGPPTQFSECIHAARLKFQRLFNHAPRRLLINFPADHLENDGSCVIFLLMWRVCARV